MRKNSTFVGVFAGADSDEVMRMINNSGEVVTIQRGKVNTKNSILFEGVKLRFDRLIASLVKDYKLPLKGKNMPSAKDKKRTRSTASKAD